MREKSKRTSARGKPPAKKVPCPMERPPLPDFGQLALDGISESVCQLDLKNRVLWANRRTAQLLGLKLEQITGRYCHRLWKGQAQPCPDCPAKLAQKTGRKQSKEVVDKQGRIWEVTVQPLKDRNGKVQSVMEFRRDVTEIRLAAERLRKEGQERAWAGQTLDQLARAADEDRVFKLIAAGVRRLAGESLVVASSYDQETGSLKVREMAGRPEHVRLVAEALAGKIPEAGFAKVPEAAVRQFCLGRLVHLKGGLTEATFGAIPVRTLKSLAAKLKVSEVWGIGLCHGRDIIGTVVVLSLGQPPRWNRELMENFTGRAAASLSRVRFESQRRFSREYFRAIIDHTSDIIAITEPEGTIKFISRAAETELGYQPESLVGRDLYEIIHPEDVPGMIARYGHELSQPDQSARFSLRVRHQQGSWLLLECTAVNLSRNREVGGVLITARNLTGESQAKAELRTTGDKLRAMFESIADGVAVIDAQGRITELNQEVLRQAGYSDKKEMLGRNVLEFIPAENRDLASRTLEQIREEGESRSLEMPFIARDGSRREFELKVSLLTGAGGRPEGFIALLKDIGQRRAAEQILKESERKFRELADFLPQTVFETDADGMITYVNQTGLAKFGYGPEDISSGISIFQVLAPEDRERARANFARRVQGGPPENQEYRAHSSRGERFEVAIYADQILESGKFSGFRGVVIDVTERNRIARDLGEAQLRIRHLLTASPAVIYSQDPARNNLMTFISDNVAEVLGYRAEEFIREPGFRRQILHPEDVEVLDRETDLLMRQGHHTFEYRLRHRDGRYRWIRDGLQVKYDQQGMPTEAIGYWIDISDLKQAEDSLLAERDIIKGIFDSSPDALLVTSLEGRIINRNRAAVELLGQEGQSALLGINITELAEDLNREKLSQIKRKVLAEGRFDDLSLVMVASDGRRIQAEATIGLTRDAQGSPLSFVAVIRDVSQRRRMEQAIRDSEEKHRLLMENINSPILSLDRDFNVLYCNQAYYEAIGYQGADLVGLNLMEKFPSFKASASCRAYQKCIKTGKPQFLEGQFNQRFLQVRVYPVKWGLLAVADDITSAKSAQQEAEESRRQLETLMGNLPGLAYRCRNDRNWTMEFVSQGCLELTGYAPEEILANRAISFGQCIHPQDREMVWDDIQQSLSARKPYQLVYRILAKGGAVKWVWEQGQGVFDQQGRLKHLEGFITDISERKLAEEALNLSEFQYRSTIDSLGEAIHVVDSDLTITLSNRVFREWNQRLGLNPEALGKDIFEIFPFLDRPRVEAEYRKVFESGQLLLTRETSRVGDSDIITETRKIPIIEDDKVIRVVTVVRDITQEVKNQEAVREKDLRLALLSDNLPSGLVYQIDSGPDNRDRRFTYISAGVEELHGLTVEQVTADGSALYQQLLPEDLERVAALEAEAAAKMTQFQAEVRVRLPSGEVRWRLFSSAPRRTEDGHLLWDGVELDITRQKQAVAEIEELNRRFESSLEAARTGFDIIDSHHNIRYVDPGWEKVLGDYRGKKCHQYFMGRDKPCQNCGIARAIKTKQKAVTEEFLHKEQRWVEVHTIPFQDASGEWLVAEFNIDIDQRKRATLALEESEERYRLLAENTREVVWTSGLDNRFTYVSPAIEKLQGFTVAEAMELGIEGLVAPGSKAKLHETQRNFEKLVKAGPLPPSTSTTVDYECLKKDGGTIWCQSTVVVLTDDQGRPVSLQGVNRDITERKRSALALQESEERYRSLAEASPDMVFVVDRQATVTYVNNAGAKALGQKPSNLVGKNLSELFPNDAERQSKNIDKVFSSGQHLSIESQTRFGDRTLWLDSWLVPLKDPDGKVSAVMGVSRDVTQSREMQARIKESEAKYRGLIEATNTGFVIVDGSGLVVDANDEYIRLTGRGSRERVLGHLVTEWTAPHDLDRNRAEVEKCAREGSVRMLEIDYQQPDGTLVPIEINATVIQTETGPLIMTLCRDISERRVAEQRLAESEAKYRQVFEGVAEGIYRSTPQGKPLMANPALARMLGYDSVEELLQRDISREGYRDPKIRQAFLERIEKDGFVGELVSEWRKKDGSPIILRENAHAVRDESGRTIYYEGTVEDITLQRKAEQELEDSRNQFRTLANISPVGIFRTDAEGRTTYVNPRWCQISGLSEKEAMGDGWLKAVHPDDRAKVKEGWGMVVSSTEPTKTEYRFVHPDGKVSWVMGQAVPDLTGEGQVAGYIGTITDITERKQAEQRLAESEVKYRTLFDQASDGIMFMSVDGTRTMVNQSFARMHGYDRPEDMENVKLNELDGPESARLIPERLRRMVEGESISFETEHRHRDGHFFSLQVSSKLVRIGEQEFFLGFHQDITERKKALQELAESELMYRTMMDQANDAIFLADPETGMLVDANLRAQQLTGRSLEELRRMHQIQLHPPEEQEGYRQIFAEHIRTGQAIEHDLILLHRDGRRVPVDISANLIEVKGRKLLQGIFHDLSERYQMEQALQESEAKYRQIFEGITEGIYRSTPEGRLLFANPALAKMLGYESPEQAQGADLNTGVYLDQARREQFKREIAQRGRVAGFESEMRSRDGTVRIVSENASLVRDQQGNPLYYDGTLEDITERKLAERALKEEKDHQELLFKVSLAVAKAPKLQDKLELTIKGIKDCRLFRKALILMEGRDGPRNHLAQYGLTETEISGILKTSIADEKRRGEILQEKYRVSNSYYIPHHQTEVHQKFSFRSVSPEYQARGSWHPDDVLIVPLNIKGVPAGYLSVDEPFDGNIPNLETIHLLELFANQAAISVENMSLYNELEKSYYDTLKAFVAAMDAKDPYTKGHSENVRHYALKIARHIGLPEKIIRLIDYSALLHDIGKLGIREEILSKPEVLSDSEYQEVKLHPVIGSRLVSEIDLLNQTEEIIYSHHEYYDGSGYPRGIKGQDIPLEARIIAVADAFEAMTSDRPYRKAFSFEVAMQRLVDAAGTQFDEQVVKAFAELTHREKPGKEDR